MIFLYKVDTITYQLNSFENNLEVTIWTTDNRKKRLPDKNNIKIIDLVIIF